MNSKNLNHYKREINLTSSFFAPKNFKNSLFNPIIASSLAFLLGGSLYGQGSITTNCGTSSKCNPITGNVVIKWGNVSNNTNFETSTSNNTTTIIFNKSGTGDGTSTGRINTVNFKDTAFKNNKIFTNSGNHTMTVTLDAGKIFNLSVEKDIFKGNLVINDTGSGDSNQIGAKFTGKFSQGMEGNITVSRTEKDNNRTTLTFDGGNLGKSNAKSTITIQHTGTSDNNNSDNGALVLDFSNNNGGNLYANFRSVDGRGGSVIIKGYNNNTITTTLYGNIGEQELGNPSTKDLNITFENAKMVGIIGHTNSSQANDFQKKVITFKKTPQSTATQEENGDNFVLEGDIISYGTGTVQTNPNTNKGNHVTFENGSMKGNIRALRINNRGGYNKVTFKDANTTFQGKIESAGSYAVYVKNDVNFEGATNNLLANGNNDVILATGNLSGGSNNIIFTSTTSKNTIKGKITANSGSNNITFKNNSSGQTNELNTINATGGSNNITFESNSGSNTITNIATTGGVNTITFGAPAK
ncbi:hypothetical protein LW135_07215, partial [Helicobacter sp. faydin-H20]|uniref:hypothetical protein n=1 Tax=Helicobacter anatolicus TaxID=2905874 RepID=UPI001E2BFC31